MSDKETTPYFFTATVMRSGVGVLRQGTLNAVDKKAALDKVYEMGRTVWKRSVLEVVIMNPFTGEIKAQSKVGEAVKQHLLPHMKEPPFEEDEEKSSGFIPWDKPVSTFMSAHMGTYFAPDKFATITGFADNKPHVRL